MMLETPGLPFPGNLLSWDPPSRLTSQGRGCLQALQFRSEGFGDSVSVFSRISLVLVAVKSHLVVDFNILL